MLMMASLRGRRAGPHRGPFGLPFSRNDFASSVRSFEGVVGRWHGLASWCLRLGAGSYPSMGPILRGALLHSCASKSSVVACVFGRRQLPAFLVL